MQRRHLRHFRTWKSLSKCAGSMLVGCCCVALEVQEHTSTGLLDQLENDVEVVMAVAGKAEALVAFKRPYASDYLSSLDREKCTCCLTEGPSPSYLQLLYLSLFDYRHTLGIEVVDSSCWLLWHYIVHSNWSPYTSGRLIVLKFSPRNLNVNMYPFDRVSLADLTRWIIEQC